MRRLFRPREAMSTDARFGGLYSISTSQGALADSAPIRQHRRSIATIKALQESASEGNLYPSVAVKPELAQDWQANVSQQDGFHSAAALREPIGMLTPYVENELTRSIKNMGRQLGMNGRRAYPSEAPPSADGDAPTKVLVRTQLLPSTVVRDLWRTSKKPLSNEMVKARAAAEAKARGAAEAKVAAMPTESERCAAGIRAVMEGKTRMGMCYDEYLSETPLLGTWVQHGQSRRPDSGRTGRRPARRALVLGPLGSELSAWAAWAPLCRSGPLLRIGTLVEGCATRAALAATRADATRLLASRSVTTDDYFSRGMEWTGAPRYRSLAPPCTLVHPVHPLTSTRKDHHHLISQVLPRTPGRAARTSCSGRRCACAPSRAACCASAITRRRTSTANLRGRRWNTFFGSAPSSAPVPRGASGGSGRLNASRGRGAEAAGRLARCLGYSSSPLPQSPILRGFPIQTRRSGTTQADRDSRKEWEARERRKEYCETICLPERAPASKSSSRAATPWGAGPGRGGRDGLRAATPHRAGADGGRRRLARPQQILINSTWVNRRDHQGSRNQLPPPSER